MEQKYWKQFMESGRVSDYLQYKMEWYAHSGKYTAPGKQKSGRREGNTGKQRELT